MNKRQRKKQDGTPIQLHYQLVEKLGPGEHKLRVISTYNSGACGNVVTIRIARMDVQIEGWNE